MPRTSSGKLARTDVVRRCSADISFNAKGAT
jgi:hypothetical protein